MRDEEPSRRPVHSQVTCAPSPAPAVAVMGLDPADIVASPHGNPQPATRRPRGALAGISTQQRLGSDRSTRAEGCAPLTHAVRDGERVSAANASKAPKVAPRGGCMGRTCDRVIE
jgi:hypothetical protein